MVVLLIVLFMALHLVVCFCDLDIDLVWLFDCWLLVIGWLFGLRRGLLVWDVGLCGLGVLALFDVCRLVIAGLWW